MVNMIYDTTSQYVVVNNEGLENAELISNYDVKDSLTAKVQYSDKDETSPRLVDLPFGSVDFEGIEYTDNMCLYQTRNDRSDSTGKMCVRNQPFVSVTKLIGEFQANGVIGLAPNSHDKSYVNQLHQQGAIENRQVGLNFEDPDDAASISTITFGYFDYSQIQGGEEGFNYYSNIGLNHWSVLMDNFKYGNAGISGSGNGKMALVDSGNTSIQIPASQFSYLKDQMQRQDSSIYVQTVDENEILVSRKKCSELYSVFSDLKFTIQGTEITIKPKGYLYSLGAQADCFIGISSIPDKYNQYRLGTIFLRNFFVGLDYENNMLLIGINKGATAAELHGKSENPFKPKEGNGAILFVITFIIVMIAVAVACFVRSKRNEQDSIIFNHMNGSDETLNKGLTDEVESENKAAAINDSITEEQEQEELDNEEEIVEQT